MVNGLDAALEFGPIRSHRQTNVEHEALPHSSQYEVSGSGLSLLFRAGERPDADNIARLVASARESGLPAMVSHRPVPDAGWLEILASGLTFDIRGLAPAEPAGAVAVEHRFGFEEEGDGGAYEPVELVPSGHIAAGAGLQPVLRTMMGLAANLAFELPVTGLYWQPARTLMAPDYFSRMVLNWLGGGAFPALGLTALLRAGDGSVASRGLAHFTGQEMQIEGRAGEPPAETMKLAIRVIDHLVRQGPISEAQGIGTGADALLFEPSQVGKLVLVWRGE